MCFADVLHFFDNQTLILRRPSDAPSKSTLEVRYFAMLVKID